MKIYFDTNVVVAAAVESHVHHIRAATALQHLLGEAFKGVLSSHGLAEIYSVLSRAPFDVPISPAQAWEVISQFILTRFEIVELSLQDYRDTVELCATRGWVGGLVHDALHLQAARVSGCSRIYTFDVRDFRRLGLELSDIVAAP